MLDVDLPVPFRLAEKRRMSWGFGVCLSEGVARVHTPPAYPSIAGNPKGKYAGALSFGYFSLGKQSKSNSPMKGEKLISIQEIE